MANPGFAKCSSSMEKWSPEPRREYYLSIYGPADEQYFALSCGMRHLGMFDDANAAYAKALSDFNGASSPAALPAGVEAVARVAKAIVGPHKALPPGASKWTLDDLRDMRWEALSTMEKNAALCSAKAVLALSASAPAQEDRAHG